MRIAFLLEDTGISRGAHLALAHADALMVRGHDVRIVTAGLAPTWRSSRAEWIYVDELAHYDRSGDDVVFENGQLKALPLIVEEEMFRTKPAREHEPLRVLIAGSWHEEDRGISLGYGAVAHARWFHQTLDLIRVSPWAPSREEPLDAVQEFHVGLTTAEMTRLLHSCDIAVVPARRESLMSLTAAEAMAAGLACVMADVPVLRGLDASQDFALFAPEDNAVELGERLIEMLENEALRSRLRARAFEVAQQWREEVAVERVLTR